MRLPSQSLARSWRNWGSDEGLNGEGVMSDGIFVPLS